MSSGLNGENMNYGILTEKGWIWEAIIDGLLPYTNFNRITAQFAEEINLCQNCQMDCFAHPIDETGRKYCTMLFYDLVKPKWKLEQLV